MVSLKIFDILIDILIDLLTFLNFTSLKKKLKESKCPDHSLIIKA